MIYSQFNLIMLATNHTRALETHCWSALFML